MKRTSTITVRVPEETRRAIEEVARKRRRQTGDAVPVSDLVREALEEYLERHALDDQQG